LQGLGLPVGAAILLGAVLEFNEQLERIGSIYYLIYAIAHSLDADLARSLPGLVVWTVAVSVLVHGISVTPLMNLHDRLQKRV